MVQLDHEQFCTGLHCKICNECLRRKDNKVCTMCLQEAREFKGELNASH